MIETPDLGVRIPKSGIPVVWWRAHPLMNRRISIGFIRGSFPLSKKLTKIRFCLTNTIKCAMVKRKIALWKLNIGSLKKSLMNGTFFLPRTFYIHFGRSTPVILGCIRWKWPDWKIALKNRWLCSIRPCDFPESLIGSYTIRSRKMAFREKNETDEVRLPGILHSTLNSWILAPDTGLPD